MKYTVIVIKDKDIINGEDFAQEDVECFMDGELLMLATGTKRDIEDVIDIQVHAIGDYKDLSRMNMLLVNRVYEKWLRQQNRRS